MAEFVGYLARAAVAAGATFRGGLDERIVGRVFCRMGGGGVYWIGGMYSIR